MNNLKDFRSICIKCGACNTSCPTYLALGGEANSPRGRLAIVEEFASGNIPVSPRMKKIISSCILCSSCASNCPYEVHHEQAMVASRNEILLRTGINPMDTFLGHTINFMYPFIKLGAKMFASGQNILNADKQFFKFANLFIPKVSTKHLLDKYPEIIKSVNTEKYRVLFYTGCLINYVYPEIGEALINYLTNNNVTVILPKSQKCCGIPGYANGFFSTSTNLINSNLKTFEEYDKKYGYDHILIACGSCGASLKGFHADKREELKGAYSQVKDKTIDFSEFILKALNVKLFPDSANKAKVTYHASCHLNNVQKVKESPLNIINSVFEDNFIPMNEYNKCCGFGGTFFVKNPKLSELITAKKINNIKNTGAETVLVSCPGCLLHLDTAMMKNNLNLEVKHLATVLPTYNS